MKKKPAAEWISVKDKFPEKDKTYIVYNSNTQVFQRLYLRDIDPYIDFVNKWTHYMEWVKYIDLLNLPQ